MYSDIMKNKPFYLIGLGCIILLIIIMPLFVCDSFNIRLRVIANMLSGFCALITLVIGILLYRRYGSDKTIINKKKKMPEE